MSHNTRGCPVSVHTLATIFYFANLKESLPREAFDKILFAPRIRVGLAWSLQLMSDMRNALLSPIRYALMALWWLLLGGRSRCPDTRRAKRLSCRERYATQARRKATIVCTLNPRSPLATADRAQGTQPTAARIPRHRSRHRVGRLTSDSAPAIQRRGVPHRT